MCTKILFKITGSSPYITVASIYLKRDRPCLIYFTTRLNCLYSVLHILFIIVYHVNGFLLLPNNKKTMAADKQFQRADTLEYEDLPKTVGHMTF